MPNHGKDAFDARLGKSRYVPISSFPPFYPFFSFEVLRLPGAVTTTNAGNNGPQCDERRPTCRRCSAQGLQCDFVESAGDNQPARTDRHCHQRNELEGLSCGVEDPLEGRAHKPLYGGTSPQRTPPRLRELGVPPFGFQSLHLLFHFEHFTSGTLLFDEILWRDRILPLALQVCCR